VDRPRASVEKDVGAPLVRRVLAALATAAGISILSFLALHSRPEKALRVVAVSRGIENEERIDSLRRELGLDRPLPARLGSWVAGIVRGDLGDSWSRPGTPVGAVLAEHLPLTLTLTLSGLLIQVVLGVGIAAVSVRRRGRWQDTLLTTVSVSIYAIPEFCLGLLLLWLFSVWLGWFPLSGVSSEPWKLAAGQTASLTDRLRHLLLPALCLGIGGAAVVARLLRVRWEEELDSPYVAAARARGLSPRRVLWTHTLRNASGPLCTAIGLSLPALVGGAVVVEQVFGWPGLGSVMMQAIGARDLPLLAGVNLVLAILVSLGGLLSDVLWRSLDPRARAS
jgi:ABC-type dipeptide/oligopeptide/nickel transport system permease component